MLVNSCYLAKWNRFLPILKSKSPQNSSLSEMKLIDLGQYLGQKIRKFSKFRLMTIRYWVWVANTHIYSASRIHNPHVLKYQIECIFFAKHRIFLLFYSTWYSTFNYTQWVKGYTRMFTSVFVRVLYLCLWMRPENSLYNSIKHQTT